MSDTICITPIRDSSVGDFKLAVGRNRPPFTPDASSLLYRSDVSSADGSGRIELHDGGAMYCVRCTQLADFFFAPESGRVTCFHSASASSDVIANLFNGPVRAILLELRGLLCVHASAVLYGGRAVGFVGHSGYGKSTLAASLVAAGHPLLTDDVLAIEVREADCLALPSYPYVRLSREVIQALRPARCVDQGPQPAHDKVAVALEDERGEFVKQPASLRALYVLARHSSASGVVIQEIGATEKFIELLRFSYCARAGCVGFRVQAIRSPD